MSDVNYNINRYHGFGTNVSFRGDEQQSKIPIITKPIDKVESIVTNTVDTFVPESQNEEKKKSHKTMIRVGSTVLVLSAIVAIFNPRFSSALVNKLKTKSTSAGNKARVDNSFWGKWNKIKEKFLTGITHTIQVLNNLNSAKDELFQKLCSKTSATKKLHNSITRGFDKISRQTIYSKYDKVNHKINLLEDIIKNYKDRLAPADCAKLEQKLAEINRTQQYFGKSQIQSRLQTQETLMSDLEKDVVDKLKQYKNDIFNGGKNSKDIFNFWAEEALMPHRNRLEAEGTRVINTLVGDGKTQTGVYKDVIELLSPHLKDDELRALEDIVKKTEKLLRKANHSECVEYFDKKRDLMLGSAPTDVVTAVASLIASGVAIGVADSKEDRVSRTISGALPVIAGLGVSTALTALLYSGGKGMALGAASSMILSGLGSAATRAIYPKSKEQLMAENASKEENKTEVNKNA